MPELEVLAILKGGGEKCFHPLKGGGGGGMKRFTNLREGLCRI